MRPGRALWQKRARPAWYDRAAGTGKVTEMASSGSYRRAALLVDFDNIYTSLRKLDPAAARVFANDPLRWATWIEERLGAVGPDSSEGTPRVLLQKICYLNPSVYRDFRPYFTRAGFRVVDCPSLTSQGKSSADIHMVIDALDLLAHPVGYDEFIVLSLDADFSPLFQRLRSFDRRVVMLGSGPSAAALRNTCDYVIPDDVFLAEALLDELGPTGEVLSEAVPPVPLPPEPETGPRSPLQQQDDGTSARGALTDAELQAASREALLRIVGDAAAPIALSRAAQDLSRLVGTDLKATGWAGCGSFKALVGSLAGGDLAYEIRGVRGYLYDPRRHDIEAAFPDQEPDVGGTGTGKLVGSWADLASRLVRVLGLPPLTPQEWGLLFQTIADTLNTRPYESMSILEKAVAAASGLPRGRVHFVCVGLGMRSYAFGDSSGHTSLRVGSAFYDNTLRLAENAQLLLDDDDRGSLSEWMLGGEREAR